MEKLGSVKLSGPLKHMRQKFGPDVPKGMAEQLFPNGSTLRCLPCGKERPATTSQIAEYLAKGFPRCKACGRMTELDNPWLSK